VGSIGLPLEEDLGGFLFKEHIFFAVVVFLLYSLESGTVSELITLTNYGDIIINFKKSVN